MKIELVRLQCVKDFIMEYGDRTFTSGEKYVFVKKGDRYVGFDDDWDSAHWMDKEDIEESFNTSNIEKIDITDFVTKAYMVFGRTDEGNEIIAYSNDEPKNIFKKLENENIKNNFDLGKYDKIVVEEVSAYYENLDDFEG